MHRTIAKLFLISILAFVMTSGSFLVSMAASETPDAQPGAQIGETLNTESPDVDEPSDQKVEDEETIDEDVKDEECTHEHEEECEACGAEIASSENKPEEIKVIEVPAQVAAAPAVNSLAPGKDNETKDSGEEPPIEEEEEPEQEEHTPPQAPQHPEKPEIEIPERISGHTVNKESVDWSEYVLPTCEEDGYYEVTFWCIYRNNDCRITEPASGFLRKDVYKIEGTALGHEPGEWVVEKEPTVDDEGLEVRKCKRCGEVLEERVIGKIIVKEITPTYVTVNGSYGAVLDEDGNAVIKDFFFNLAKGSNAEEEVVITVGGKSYTFTRYANGKVSGQLPPGFSISGRDLKISGLKDTLDIQHTALGGGVSEDYEPGSSVGGGYVFEDGAYEEPTPSVGRTASTRSTTTSGGNGNNATGNNLVSYAESLLNNIAGDNADSAADATLDNAEDKPSASSFFKAEPKGGANGGLMLSESEDGTPSKLVIAVDVALIAALILGIGVLWKLGILKSLR